MRLVTISLLLCVLGTVADDDPKKADGDKFKGEWKTLSVKQGGQVAPEEITKTMTFNFDGKKYVQKVGDQTEEGEYTLDATQTPKTIDLDIKTGNDQGKKQLGIYKIEDTKLTLIFAAADSKDRPKSFTPAESEQAFEFVIEKAKP